MEILIWMRFIYSCFKELEQFIEIQAFTEEILKIANKVDDSLSTHDLIKKAKEIYSDYVVKILKGHILQAIHHKLTPGNNSW